MPADYRLPDNGRSRISEGDTRRMLGLTQSPPEGLVEGLEAVGRFIRTIRA
jgi:hypothetical protein